MPFDPDEHDDEFAHVTTGVLNLSDFADFDELMSAAEEMVTEERD